MGLFKKIKRGIKKIGKRINIGKAAMVLGGIAGAAFTGGASLKIAGKGFRGLIKKKPKALGGMQQVEFQSLGGLNSPTQSPFSFQYNNGNSLSGNSYTNGNRSNNSSQATEGANQIATVAAIAGAAKLLNIF